MKKINKLIALIFVASINLTAQLDTTKKEFYPLQIGNLWQYRNEFNQLLTTAIISDTLLESEIYFKFDRIALKTQSNIMRIDSLLRVQNRRGGPTAGDSCGGNTPFELSIYHLGESDSSAWEICAAFNGIPTENQLVRFNRIFLANIFGQPREVMEFDFGGAPPNEDTIWNFGALLAKGIGVLEEHYFEHDYEVLYGAIINGVQYGTIVSTDEIIETIPLEIKLYQNYPNPFNPTTRIRYEISETTYVELNILNILGQKIEILVDEIQHPGSYEIEFNGSELSSGVYVAVLQTTEAQLTKCMLLIK